MHARVPRVIAPIRIGQFVLVVLLGLVCLPRVLPSRALTRDQELSKLELRERHLLLAQRQAAADTLRLELETTRDLFVGGYVTQLTYDRTRNSYEEARLNLEEAEIALEETKLALLQEATRVAVREARKYRSADGRSFVDLYLENASDVHQALLVDPTLRDQGLRDLLRVENVFVSLTRGAIVAEPYETRIPALELGERKKLTFRLLRDEEAVVVSLSYLDVDGETRSVILKKGGQQSLPTINSSQFSQAGELKRKVRYDLVLERLAEEESSFALAVAGLPRNIDYAFLGDGARVNRVSFDGFTSRDTLALELTIPAALDPQLIDRPRTFYAIVSEAEESRAVGALIASYGDRPLPESEVRDLAVSYVALELTPRGAGELEVLVANRYQELTAGSDFLLSIQFINRGTATVRNVEAAIDLPYRWESSVEPKLIEALEPGRRVAVRVVARPPSTVSPATYEMGIEARGQVGNENVESRKKSITIRVQPRSGWTANALLLGGVLLIVLVIGAAAVRITRR